MSMLASLLFFQDASGHRPCTSDGTLLGKTRVDILQVAGMSRARASRSLLSAHIPHIPYLEKKITHTKVESFRLPS